MAFDELFSSKGDKASRIEELLAKLGGNLKRASELVTRPRVSRNLSLDDVLPDAGEVGGGRTGVRLRVSEVPVLGGGEGGHPRGYVFRPPPQWHRHSPYVSGDVLRMLGSEGLADVTCVPLTRMAFLDTETTGLGGVTGTYAFLVGIGFFRLEWPEGAATPQRAHFVCEQYFMEDYPHEAAMLELVAARLREFDMLVTFNGAGYDLPLLQARATLNRKRLPLNLPHLDLLWPARRLWRRRLGSCSLASLERHVLGVRRTNDVPGAEIPYIYF
ncbi:MAG: ribonuclease H-like domain-containing protein, partial [Candidatus Sumerlaeaceae bacterium]|nr:ribonuclease H-like domain-containing protein [Candidatus Sumerlaeaceae bacterium]